MRASRVLSRFDLGVPARGRVVCSVVVALLILAVPGGMLAAQEPEGQLLSGEGQTVVVIDTGVDGSHPLLDGRVVGEACFSAEVVEAGEIVAESLCPSGDEVEVGPGAGVPCSFEPECGHGTHVAGLVTRVAPGADLVSVQVMSASLGGACVVEEVCAGLWLENLVAALEWVESEVEAGSEFAAVNVSLGAGWFYPECPNDDAADVIWRLSLRGVPVVAATGNFGSPRALVSPACVPDAVSVAAVSHGMLAGFSNATNKVTLGAEGADQVSALPGGGCWSLSGTSMAAPQVSGGFALVAQALGDVSLSERRAVLEDSGHVVSDGEAVAAISVVDPHDVAPGVSEATGVGFEPDLSGLAAVDAVCGTDVERGPMVSVGVIGRTDPLPADSPEAASGSGSLDPGSVVSAAGVAAPDDGSSSATSRGWGAGSVVVLGVVVAVVGVCAWGVLRHWRAG
ncbi:MAG: S8 family serine peptidase [bacterium]|nr:S8 family serine peptidase [bacterium]